MKIRMTFMMILIVFSGLLSNVYGESYQRWTGVPGRVLTSNDFLADPDLVARNDDLVLIFLDAAQIPEVSIPYENSQTHTRTICWDQRGSSHTATLIDESGNAVFTLGPGECVSPTIEEGLYTLSFTHDGTGGPATFVLEPASGETEVSANYSQKDLDQLKNTNQCPRCDLRRADLRRADLSEANLRGADLRWANLSGANLSGANLTNAFLYKANLSGANLYKANLSGARLYKANLSGAILSEANLSEADLLRANLSGANLSGANLRGADLRWANLSGADLSGADLSGVRLIGANLSGADLSGVMSYDRSVSRYDYITVDLRRANLSGANLSEAVLDFVDLSEANLSGANLTNAFLSGANLTGAVLSGALWVDGSRCGQGSVGRCVPIRPN